MLRRRRAESIFENAIGFGEGFVDVAETQFELVANVRLLPGFDMREIGECFGRAMGLMNQRRPWLGRFEHIEHRRQRLIIDFDKLQRIFRRAPVDGGNGYDRVADVADFLHAQDRLIAKRRTEVRIDARHLGHFRAGQNNGDAGNFFGSRFFNARDPRVGVRAA